MTLNTREVDQKIQIYWVIFPFLLVFLWVPTHWGFEKQKILGTSSRFGRAGRFTVGAFPVRFKQTASEDRSRWQLRWVGLALLRATRSNRWGRRCFSWTGWDFFGTGGGSRWLFWGLQIFTETAGPQKKGVENSEVFGKTLWKISDDILDILGVCWFLIELCVFVQDGSLAGSWWFLGLDHWSRQQFGDGLGQRI